MEEIFDFNNILSEEEVSALFSDEEVDTTPEVVTEENNSTVEDENPESVDSVDDTDGKEDVTVEDGGNLSQPTNFYSSIASALKSDVLPDLPDDLEVKTAEDFASMFETYVQSKLDERYKRVDEALNAGIQPTVVQQYESTLNYLSNLNKESLSQETEAGEKLRKDLIYADYINRGYSKERATREVEKSLKSGSDIDDAVEAVKSNIDYYQNKYNDLIADAKAQEEEYKATLKKNQESLKRGIMEKQVLGNLQVDRSVRQKALDAVTKPVYRDDAGEVYNAVQKYGLDNPVEFQKNIGLLYVLTDGFKNVDRLVNGKVKKEMKKNLRALEDKLTGSPRFADGGLDFMSGVGGDGSASFSKIVGLDL